MREVASRELEPAAKREKERLVEFRRGNTEAREAAFEALFRLHQRAVRGWILRIVRDPGAADELTVESFWRIYRARVRFEPERGFEPWARRIATRAALDWLRAQKPEYAVANEFFADLPSPGGQEDPAVSAEIRRKTALAFGRLWPAMLRRLRAESVPAGAKLRVPWFDWALAGGLALLLAVFPAAIPVLLYYL